MNAQDYKLLTTFLNKRLKQPFRVNTRFIESSDIINEVYSKVGFTDIPSFKHEINKYILAQKIYPKSIYINGINDSGLILIPSKVLDDNLQECKHCKELKSINVFGTSTRYATGQILRLKVCKKCVAQKARSKRIKKGRRKVHSDIKEGNRVRFKRWWNKNRKLFNDNLRKNYDPQKRKEKYLKSKIKIKKQTSII